MNPLSYAYLIPLLPALGFLLNMLFGYRLGKRGGAYLSVGLLLTSTLLATALLLQVRQAAPVWDKAAVFEVLEAEEALPPLEEVLSEAKAMGASRERVEALEAEIALAEEKLTELEHEALIREPAADFPFSSETPWITIAGEQGIPFGFLLDPFAALMVFMVSLVSLLIHLFSVEYMAGEERYPTFFAYISLFAAAMLGMVMSRNLFLLLLFWELMGVMSYLLIGFFYKKVSAQQAMKKAFLVTKLADLGLLVGIFWIYRAFGTLDLLAIGELAPGLLAGSAGVATGIGLLLFLGAMGKSAQFPLHVWLLDAMEGPTPVSAMIHAATMVAAGVYLMARAYPILEMGNALPLIAWVGGLTALFAAALAPAFADIKKILAWSTVSQLGFMFLGLGAFGWIAAIFHLVAHAFFKSLLFLGSGSMIHGSGTQDIFAMNQLKKYMPSTRWTFIIGGLSLAGVFPFAGFWSKDEILLAVKNALSVNGGYGLLLLIGYAASFLTALYISRTYLIAFEQAKRPSPWQAAKWNQGGLGVLNMSAEDLAQDAEYDHHDTHDTPHESGWHITTALWVLAISATVFGIIGSPFTGNALQGFVYRGIVPELEPLSAQWLGFIVSTLVALSGITLAYLLYGNARLKLQAPQLLTQLLQQRFYLDQAYYFFAAGPLTRLAKPLAWFDRRIIDALVDFLAWLVAIVGDALRRVQTGRLEHYAWTMAAAAVVLLLALSFGGQL